MNTSDLVLAHLRQYDLKQKGNEWRCNSPLRPGSNSHAFTLTIDDGEHGAYYDHASGERGSLYELAERLGIETPKPTQRQQATITKRAYRDLAEYAEAHGLEADDLLKAGWEDVKQHQNRPALLYATQNGKRVRFIDGEKPYYKSVEVGYSACWYGLKRAVEIATKQGKGIILCNGEISTISGQSWDLPACAITNGEKRLPDNLLEEFKAAWQGAVYIALDCDATGKRVANEIAAQLAGYDISIVDLGLTDGGDLADFCKLHTFEARTFWDIAPQPAKLGIETLQRDGLADLAQTIADLNKTLRSNEQAKQAQDLEAQLAKASATIERIQRTAIKPSIRSFAEVAKAARERLKQRYDNPSKIPGLETGFRKLDLSIGGLDQGTVTVIYGATSMGKSTLLASMFRTLKDCGGGLIVSTETPPEVYMFRLAGSLCNIPISNIKNGRLTPGEYGEVDRMIDSLGTLGWDFEESPSPTPKQLRATTLAGVGKYKLVIVDSVSRMVNAGDYSEVAEANNTIQELAHGTKIPFLVTSQVGRDVSKRGEGMKRPQLHDGYGGGVIEQDADTVLGVYRHDWYVAQGLEKPSELYPPDTAQIIILKSRDGDGAGKFFTVKHIGGAGFYPLETERTEP